MKPLVVGIFYGKSKPVNVDSYFKDLIDELLLIKNAGLLINGKNYSAKLCRIIADAPARAFLKQCKLHNSYAGCEKCTYPGKYKGRVVFDELNWPLRNNANFRSQTDIRHHTGISPLVKLDFDIVSGIPLDYMHLVCLGVVKKLLRAWVKGIGKTPHKIAPSKIVVVNTMLCEMSTSCPKEFSRRPRSLKDLDLWKATEFRSFLLYTGPVVLKGILYPKVYNHFMLLSVAIRLLVSPTATNTQWNCYAKQLLIKFVEMIPSFYGIEFMVYNVHSLVHLSDDVMLHGPLDKFSAFRYENNMQLFKRSLRAKFKPFEQIVNRIKEMELVSQSCTENAKSIRISLGNNCYLLKSGDVIKILNIINDTVYYRKFKNKSNFFDRPCSSEKLFVHLVSNLSRVNVIDKSELSLKCWLIPYKDVFVSFPLVN